jgi:filamentous hemagglutinin family protein
MKRRYLAFFAAAICASSAAFGAPVAPVVTSGNAVLSGGIAPLNTNGTTSGSISWQSFNIGSSQSARFQQPSGSIAVLNRTQASASALSGIVRTSSTVSVLAPMAAGFADGAVTIRMPLVDVTPISIR